MVPTTRPCLISLLLITLSKYIVIFNKQIKIYSLFGFGMLLTQPLQRRAVLILKPNVNKLLHQIVCKYSPLSFTGSVVCVVASSVFIRQVFYALHISLVEEMVTEGKKSFPNDPFTVKELVQSFTICSINTIPKGNGI